MVSAVYRSGRNQNRDHQQESEQASRTGRGHAHAERGGEGAGNVGAREYARVDAATPQHPKVETSEDRVVPWRILSEEDDPRRL